MNRSVIRCKWIFKTKRDADGNIDRYKARLVAQGYNQTYGIDYDETFSPVVRFESARSIIALATNFGLKLHQMDIKTAFLNGSLQEEIYMKQPTGFVEEGKENYVCKLKRSIYGLKQSARCWNSELDKQLKSMGFIQSSSDPCIYIHISGEEIFLIAVYVDDIILAGENDKMMRYVKNSISQKFTVTDMGQMYHFLGVKVIQNLENNMIWIGQPSYTKELLIRFKMEESKPVDTPFDVSMKLLKAKEGDELFDKMKYQSAVGSLLYLSTRTRPDIAYAVSHIARFAAEPTPAHWTAVKRILRYLNGTQNLGLTYVNENNSNLMGYSDADWAGDLNDRKSTSGYLFKLCGSVVSWKSKKQSCVALSTAEAEYMALASTIQEAIWLRQLLQELQNLKGKVMKPTVIFEDNQSTICIARNPQYHGRTKHIDIKFHFVREQVALNKVVLEYCKSENMIADILTKALHGPQFKRLRNMMGMKIELKLPSTIEREC